MPAVSTNAIEDQPSKDTVAAAEHLTRALGRAISPSTLHTYRCRKRGPAYYKSHNGQMVRYRVADLDAYAATRLAPPMQRIEPQPETRSP